VTTVAAILSVRGLYAGYQKLSIIQDISIEIGKGEIVAMVGPNGSGKSTLLKSVVGLVQVFGGDVSFEGKNITGRKPEEIVREGIGYVPQMANVFTKMSVRENIELGASLLDRSGKEEALRRTLALFPSLSPKLREKAGNLSGGERQMVAIGRAMAANPKLLLLDEPTAGVAPIVAEQLFRALLGLRTQGVTVLLVEQNARRALTLAERGIVMTQGRKVYDGPSKDILDDQAIRNLFLGEPRKADAAGGSRHNT
jgi:ABC-type branched-subunit amino acid transport system ATPase component